MKYSAFENVAQYTIKLQKMVKYSVAVAMYRQKAATTHPLYIKAELPDSWKYKHFEKK